MGLRRPPGIVNVLVDLHLIMQSGYAAGDAVARKGPPVVWGIDSRAVGAECSPMSERIFPRSPRETMCGWMHLPRYIDKVRLHLAGRLHADYQPNFGKGFDGLWLKHAGITHEQMLEVVRGSLTDGEVCDWVFHQVTKTNEEKRVHAEAMMAYPAAGDDAAQARLQQRKEQAGIGNREDVRTFVDLIDADEGRI